MADLAPEVAGEIARAGVSVHQLLMTESGGNIMHANQVLRSIANKKFDEIGGIEARAVDRVLDESKPATKV